MWVEDHKFLPVRRGVWIMPPFQELSVNQIGTSINLSWEHLAQKELWCTSDVVHGVGRVLAEVHSTAVISYPGNGNIKLEQWQPGITLDCWASALAHSRRIGQRQGDESDYGARRSKNRFGQWQRKIEHRKSRSVLSARLRVLIWRCVVFAKSACTIPRAPRSWPRIFPNDTHIGAFEITKVLGKDGPLPFNVIPCDSWNNIEEFR